MKARRRILSLLPMIFAGAAPLLLITGDALARAGGGEGFHSGGGGGGFGGGHGGGGGGGGDIFWLIYLWFRFCVAYPWFGIPITAVGLLLLYHGARKGNLARQGSIIRRGSPLIDAARAREASEELRASDPAFDEPKFYARVANAFEKIQRAWCAQDMAPARAFISDGVFERFSLQIAEQRDLGWRDVMEQIQVEQVRLAEVWRGSIFTTATCRVSASAINYRVSIKDGARVSGSTSPDEFAEYWTFLRRSDAQTVMRDGLIEGRCPNCGASLEMNQSAICPNCGALLQSGRYDWVLVEITQEYEWQPSDSSADGGPAGLDDMRQHDPDLSLAAIEDRASVLFWRWIMTQRTGDLSLLARAASPALLEKWQHNIDQQKQTGNVRTWLGECAVGSVETQRLIPGDPASKGNDAGLDRAIILVRWMGTQFEQQFDAGRPAGPPRRGQQSQVLQTLLILSRAAGATSDPDRGVSSAHCPKCGAPETGGNSTTCPYCGTVLNDGLHGWLLHDVLSAASDEGRALLAGAGISEDTSAPAQSIPSTLAQLTWMARMAASDGQIEQSERDMIMDTARRCGIPPQRVEAILSAAQSGNGELPTPANHAEARQWIEAMVATGLSDGRIAPQELALFQTVAARAGLSNADLRMILSQQRAQLHQAARQALRDARQQTS